jgi:hypothetical protein
VVQRGAPWRCRRTRPSSRGRSSPVGVHPSQSAGCTNGAHRRNHGLPPWPAAPQEDGRQRKTDANQRRTSRSATTVYALREEGGGRFLTGGSRRGMALAHPSSRITSSIR